MGRALRHSDHRVGGWVFGGVNSAANNNEILLCQLLFGPRFIGWVGGWFRPIPTIAEFFNKKRRLGAGAGVGMEV